MNYLLDTCVISEYTRRQPEKKVLSWVDATSEEHLFLCAITIGELQRGIERLGESKRRTELMTWLNGSLVPRFAHRILPLDAETMFLWGSMLARLESSGHPTPVMDSLIAAAAMQNNLILVTRNSEDFIHTGVQLLNPWQE